VRLRKKKYMYYRRYSSMRRPRQRLLRIGAIVTAVVVVAAVLVWKYMPAAVPATVRAGPSSRQPAPGPAVAAVPTDSQALGIAAGSGLPALSSQDLSARMAGIAATGATWVRFDFDWSQIQPDNSNSYNWSSYDKVVAAAASSHLQVLGIVDFTPAWARSSNCASTNKCPPASAATYAQFPKVLANRYASQNVHYWEVWNEPNNPNFWQPGDNPKAYVSLLKAAYAALHAADSHAYVITAGLSPQADSATSMSPVHFLTALYNDGAQGYFDAVADHPYTFPLTPASTADDAWAQMGAPTNSLRAIMVAHGDVSKKIWITEFGAPTGGPGPVATVSNPNLAAQPYTVDQGLQAKDLSDAIAAYRTYGWAGPFLYYTYQDAGTDPSTNENFFGLVSAGGAQKQAYTVFQQAANTLR
jgi:polysaccharide biosynthesis protein PslG